MTLLLSLLVVASILSMAWAFLAAGSLESSVKDLEKRSHAIQEEEHERQSAAQDARKGDSK